MHDSKFFNALLGGLVLLMACGDDDASGGAVTDSDGGSGDTVAGSSTDPAASSGTGGEDTTGGGACLDEPAPGAAGQAIPHDQFQFRNAFDPSDETIYDPGDVAALPGPLMVDTWGDRAQGPHGTLGVFPPGFVAPLHTHTDAYDGVVLRGQMSNPFGTDLEAQLDDDASNDHGETVLGPGSYWHVPAGSQHTTTCLGPEACWFYFHAEDAFDFAPIVDGEGALVPGVTLEDPDPASVLLPNAELEFAGDRDSFVQFAPAWGSMADDAHGTFGEFEAGAVSAVHVHGEDYYGVVITGTMSNPFDQRRSPPLLTTGGYWSVPADSVHTTTCDSDVACLFYFHARGGFDFVPLCEQPG